MRPSQEECRMSGRQGQRPPRAREPSDLGLGGQPSDFAGRNRELGGRGRKRSDLRFLRMQNVFNRHFPFGKIKVRLSFRARDNVVTMTHRGRHEQVTVSGVSLKYQNQT